MPKIKENKTPHVEETNKPTYMTYNRLLQDANKRIIEKYGSVRQFAMSEDAKKITHEGKEFSLSSIVNYLSIPKENGKKKSVSMPFISALYETLWSKKLEERIRVIGIVV